MRRGLLVGAVLCAMCAAVSPAAALERLGPMTVHVSAFPVADGRNATVDLAVRATQAGEVYGKLLPTPGNPIHDGTASYGVVDADHTYGIAGWWLAFEHVVETDDVRPLGVFADGTPAGPIVVSSDEHVVFRVTVHAPAGAPAGSPAEVLLAVGFRGPSSGATGSGGQLDESLAFRLKIRPATGGSSGGTGIDASSDAPDPATEGPDSAAEPPDDAASEAPLDGEADPAAGRSPDVPTIGTSTTWSFTAAAGLVAVVGLAGAGIATVWLVRARRPARRPRLSDRVKAMRGDE